MQYHSYIEERLSHLKKGCIKLFAREAKKNQALLSDLVSYLKIGEMPLVWRVVNVIKVIAKSAPKYIKPFENSLVEITEQRKQIDPLVGILFRIHRYIKTDLSANAHLIDIAIMHILKPSKIGYNKGYALELLAYALDTAPELKEEFKELAQQSLEMEEKQYVRNCAQRLLKKIAGIKTIG